MKKVLLLSMVIAGLLFSTDGFAQTSYGVKAGIDFYNMTIKSPSENTTMVIHPDIGVYADLPIADEFFIRPELALIGKGTKITDGNTKLHVSYLELPVSFLYKGDLSGGKVLVGLGPYIALGVVGKAKYNDGSSNKIKFKNTITQAEDNSNNWYVKPFDFGGKVYAGYELKNGISVTLESSLGLTNIEPEISGESNNQTAKNVGFGLNVAYRIK
jgi:hypothetical protein